MANTLPSSLQHIALFFERLPGIGAKTASRLAFYLLRMPEQDLKEFAQAVAVLKTQTKRCRICYNLTESDLCSICDDPKRDKSVITVVEDVMDLLSFETGNIYEGVYHVLHGRIDPLNHIGPDDIFIPAFINRIKHDKDVKEIILATNPDMEGESTAMYIRNRLNDLTGELSREFRITRLAYGLPMGGNVEYADYMTLKKAIEGRSNY